MPIPSTAHPQIHGHRGCRGLFPENTLPAFLHALALGVDVLELDVIISADKQVVVAHEPWLAAHLGFSAAGLPISPSYEQEHNLYQLSYEVIRQCAVGTLPHPLFPQQQQVPTYRPLLSEVLQAAETACRQLGRSPVGYSIEIKSTRATEGIYHPSPAEFVALVLGTCTPDTIVRTTLLSFDYRVLQAAHQQMPNLALCLLTELPFSVSTVFQELGFVPEMLGPDYRLLSQELMQQLRQHYPHLRVASWTVNNIVDWNRVAAWGVFSITTDFPDRMQVTLNERV